MLILLLTDYTITDVTEKLFIFKLIVDLQEKLPQSQEPYSIYNKIMQHSTQYACIYWQCIVIFAHGVPIWIMGFNARSISWENVHILTKTVLSY